MGVSCRGRLQCTSATCGSCRPWTGDSRLIEGTSKASIRNVIVECCRSRGKWTCEDNGRGLSPSREARLFPRVASQGETRQDIDAAITIQSCSALALLVRLEIEIYLILHLQILAISVLRRHPKVIP